MSEELVSPPNERPLPQGERFSLVYLERGKRADDSQRMRHRVGALINSFDKLPRDLDDEIEREIGIEVFSRLSGWPSSPKEMELPHVLDLITIAHRFLCDFADWETASGREWRLAVQRIFEEENVTYRIDSQGGVHFHVDEEFAFSNAATIAALQPARYANARHAFEGGQGSLRQVPPDGKGAIRGTFGGLEAVFRLMYPRASKLTADEAEQAP